MEALTDGPLGIAATGIEINASCSEPSVDLFSVEGDDKLVRGRFLIDEPNRIDR